MREEKAIKKQSKINRNSLIFKQLTFVSDQQGGRLIVESIPQIVFLSQKHLRNPTKAERSHDLATAHHGNKAAVKNKHVDAQL